MLMSPKSIVIIGAGIAGLTLARCLRQKGIQATILDKVSSTPNYSYGITLYPRAYGRLSNILGIDEATFRTRVAVDADLGGIGSLQFENCLHKTEKCASPLRAHRAKLESLLREGLDIKLGYNLNNIEMRSQGLKLAFENGHHIHSNLVIGADGVHSQVRKHLIPNSAPRILPFVVFNGKRQMDEVSFHNIYAPAMQNGTLLESRHGNIMLQISVSERTRNRTRISYTYSRPAYDNDSLYNPGRALAGANDIPEAFYEEVQQLKELNTPFSDTFNPQIMRNDRILHWLMRTTLMELDDLTQLAGKRIVLIGDSVHAQPIVGGMGANSAIVDGIELAEVIAAKGFDCVTDFYNIRHEDWKHEVNSGEEALRSMHSPSNNGEMSLGRQSAL